MSEKELRYDPGAYYTETSEWVRFEGDGAVVGITDYAQDQLSDIVYVEFPDVGDAFAQGDSFGVVESVKAASDCYMPLSGEITAANDELEGAPELMNEDPYGAAWMIKLKPSNKDEELGKLMDAAAYEKFIQEEIEKGGH
jgi:glycine cleavage system H protein